LDSFDHAMRPRQRIHFLGRFRAVELHRMQAQSSRQRYAPPAAASSQTRPPLRQMAEDAE